MAAVILVNVEKSRNYSILKFIKKFACLGNIFNYNLFIFEDLNASKIKNKLSFQYKDNINNSKVENLLKKIRLIIYIILNLNITII